MVMIDYNNIITLATKPSDITMNGMAVLLGNKSPKQSGKEFITFNFLFLSRTVNCVVPSLDRH